MVKRVGGQLLTTREVAARLGITQPTVRQQIKNGALKAQKISPTLWVVAEEEVDRYEQENRRRAYKRGGEEEE